jgi:hypothetical protein
VRSILATLLVAASASASPIRLQVEHQADPLAVGNAQPHFSWQSDATEAGWHQSGYEIRIATRPHKLAHPDVWDSGRVNQSASVDIAYAGAALGPATRFVWQVRTWDSAGHASLSAPASFETAPADLNANASWIRRSDPAADRELAATHWLWLANQDAMHVPSGQQAEFRYTLHLDSPPQEASLHVIARGDFIVRVFHGPELFLARLDITLPNGHHQIIATDGTWKTSTTPTLSAEIYGGEVYDARRPNASANWSAASFNDDALASAEVAAAPAAELTAQPDLSIHRTDVLHPISVTRLRDIYVLDMGQNMVGNIALRVSGARGTTVRMRYAERLNPDGSVYLANLRNATATDFYTLSGHGAETWTPSFTFHGFRYVELTGFPGVPSTASVEGVGRK